MFRKTLALCALCALLPTAAFAAGTFSTFGPRVGFSTGPDQIVFGGQLQMMDVAPDIDLVPSLDFGFGDNTTTVSINGDLHYRFQLSGSKWSPYAGAGIGVHFYSFDHGNFEDNSVTRAGGSVVLGADVPTQSGNRFFSELKLGLGDSPDLKFLVGWNFKL